MSESSSTSSTSMAAQTGNSHAWPPPPSPLCLSSPPRRRQHATAGGVELPWRRGGAGGRRRPAGFHYYLPAHPRAPRARRRPARTVTSVAAAVPTPPPRDGRRRTWAPAPWVLSRSRRRHDTMASRGSRRGRISGCGRRADGLQEVSGGGEGGRGSRGHWSVGGARAAAGSRLKSLGIEVLEVEDDPDMWIPHVCGRVEL
jgi:hypothetical protein